MRRVVTIVTALTLLATACSDDTDEPSTTTTLVSTTTTSTTTTAPPDESTTTSPTTTSPAPRAAGGPVAVTLHNGVVSNGEVIADNAITYVGTHLGDDAGTGRFNFDGVAGPSSDLALMSAPQVTTGADWPPGRSGKMARRFIDEVLPAFVDDEDLTDPPFGGVDTLFIADVLISGTTISLPWEIVEHDDDHVVIRVDHEFEHRSVQRGAEAILVGTVIGEFRVSRRTPLDAEGRIDARFDLTSLGATIPVHRWWEAVPVDTIEADEWTGATDGIERFTDMLTPPTGDPDVFDVAVGYGGRTWQGRMSIAQTWSQFGPDREPTTVESEVRVAGSLTADGQWLRLGLDEWVSDGPGFRGVDNPDTGPDFALVIAPDGRVGEARLRNAEERDSRSERIWFSRIFVDALPALPEERIFVGASWQARLQGEQDGTGPIYTVVALGPRYLDLEVTGAYGLYIGDRDEGYTVSATIDGTLRIDRQAAVPIDVDIETVGTITFGVAGEPDPSTTEPWRSTLTIRSVENTDAG